MPPKKGSKYKIPQKRRRKLKRKPIQLATHVFVRKMARKEIDLTGTATFVDYQGLRNTKISDVLDVTDFSNLFEQYKINKVKITFRWMLNSGAAGATSPGAGYISGPLVNIIQNRYAMDHAGTQTEFQSKAKNIQIRLTPYGSKTYTYTPNILAEGYRTATSTGYSPKYNTWINFDDLAVPHFGLDCGVDNMNVFQGKISVDVEVCFSCKGME